MASVSGQQQSRRFQSLVPPQAMFSLCKMLETNTFVSFYKWSEKEIYLEVNVKKTPGYFKNGYPALELIRIVSIGTIPDSEIKGEHGHPMETRQISKEAKALSTPEKLKQIYKTVREEKVIPNLTEDVEAMLNKKEYEIVINNAIIQNYNETYDITLRPWQRKALAKINGQNSREILWIFDFNGNTGKTEFNNFLEVKQNFQNLSPGMLFV